MTGKDYNFWLANLNRIGVKKIELLLQYFGSSEEVYHASGEELEAFREECCRSQLQFSASDIRTLCESRIPDKIQENYAKLRKNGIYFVSKEDEQYPVKLRNIYGAPFGIYYRGRLPGHGEKLIAVVGARECTAYGREMARYLSGAITKAGIHVISGLARGIDAYSHEGALSADGITYGVLGCGIDICYPRENINLFMAIQKNGGVISEYAPGVQPVAGNFPMRNRIISGLSDGILVIEAKSKSGSLITADLGLEQGKDIYALPGRASDCLSEGCNNLIKMGAKLVTTPEDILEDFIPDYVQSLQDLKKNNKILETTEEIVYASLCLDPRHIEEIAHLTGLSLEVLMEQLLLLELRGYVRQTMKNYYIKI